MYSHISDFLLACLPSVPTVPTSVDLITASTQPWPLSTRLSSIVRRAPATSSASEVFLLCFCQVGRSFRPVTSAWVSDLCLVAQIVISDSLHPSLLGTWRLVGQKPPGAAFLPSPLAHNDVMACWTSGCFSDPSRSGFGEHLTVTWRSVHQATE
jgi:hypothetical protein